MRNPEGILTLEQEVKDFERYKYCWVPKITFLAIGSSSVDHCALRACFPRLLAPILHAHYIWPATRL